MSSYYSVERAENGTITLNMKVGMATVQARGLKDYQVDGFMGAFFLRKMRSYAQHRIRAFRQHPNERLPEREEAFKKLVYCCDQAKSTDMPKVVINLQDSLLILLPSVMSRSHRAQSQFVFDLINLAYELGKRTGGTGVSAVVPKSE